MRTVLGLKHAETRRCAAAVALSQEEEAAMSYMNTTCDEMA
jgi:hypothetical protein